MTKRARSTKPRKRNGPPKPDEVLVGKPARSAIMTVLVVTEESITEKFLSSSPEDILDSGNAGIFGKSMLRLDFEGQDDAAYQLNSEVYSKAREWKVAIEAHKRKLTRPHKAKIDEITATLKPVLAAVEKVIDEANCRAGAYLVLLEERRRKQEDDLKEIAMLFGSVEAPEVDLVQPCSPQTVLVTKRVRK